MPAKPFYDPLLMFNPYMWMYWNPYMWMYWNPMMWMYYPYMMCAATPPTCTCCAQS